MEVDFNEIVLGYLEIGLKSSELADPEQSKYLESACMNPHRGAPDQQNKTRNRDLERQIFATYFQLYDVLNGLTVFSQEQIIATLRNLSKMNKVSLTGDYTIDIRRNKYFRSEMREELESTGRNKSGINKLPNVHVLLTNLAFMDLFINKLEESQIAENALKLKETAQSKGNVITYKNIVAVSNGHGGNNDNPFFSYTNIYQEYADVEYNDCVLSEKAFISRKSTNKHKDFCMDVMSVRGHSVLVNSGKMRNKIVLEKQRIPWK